MVSWVCITSSLAPSVCMRLSSSKLALNDTLLYWSLPLLPLLWYGMRKLLLYELGITILYVMCMILLYEMGMLLW